MSLNKLALIELKEGAIAMETLEMVAKEVSRWDACMAHDLVGSQWKKGSVSEEEEPDLTMDLIQCKELGFG